MTDHQPLLRSRLLEYYASASRADTAALDATALRSESAHMREIYAHRASFGTLDATELTEAVLRGSLSAYGVEPLWLARLARVCALQNTDEADQAFAAVALRLAVPRLIQESLPYLEYLTLQAELFFITGEFSQLESLLAAHPGLRRLYHGYLSVDAKSPFVTKNPHRADESQWLRGFNRQFTANGLLPVHLDTQDATPFNRLRARTEDLNLSEGPLVTVIMTTYQPVRDDAVQSARSILDQTWRRLELLIVDDASGAEHAETLRELERMDPRVRLLRLPENVGTYRARNAGISEAQGEFITGQDADDWSHPQRIETQVLDLLDSPEIPGNQVYTANMTEDLVRIRTGYSPFIPSAPTLMVRAHLLRQVGGYLPARKAADNELRGRIGAYAGTTVHLIKLPLIFMRILPGSLSRADFRPGWQHPARRAFWSTYKTWHSQATAAELCLQNHARSPIPIPPRFTSGPEHTEPLDVVFAADWCEFGNLQADMLEEIAALRDSGYRIGVLHMENAMHLSRVGRKLCRPVQELVSSGTITQVLPDEQFHEVSLLLVRAPEVLQFMPHGRSAWTPETVVVTAENPPEVGQDRAVTYVPEQCADHAERFFDRRPRWVSGSEAVREALRGYLPWDQLAKELYTPPFDSQRWEARRVRPRGNRPVIGAWTGSHPIEWPADPHAVEALLPQDSCVDVRLYGAPESLLQAMGERRQPAAWTAFPVGSIDRETYYRSIDVFLHYPRLPGEKPERSVREALAAGCLVILPHELHHVYGPTAVYADPHDVPAVIRRHLGDHHLYREGAHRSALDRVSVAPSTYIRLIESLAQEVLVG